MVMNWLKETTAAARATLAAEASKWKNKEFMEAIVAATVKIAAADGSIEAAEKAKMMGFVQRSDELKNFDPKTVIATFSKLADNYDFDYSIGNAETLKVITRVKGNEEQARMVVRVAMVIGASDGNFDEKEKAAVRTICAELGLNPADFDL